MRVQRPPSPHSHWLGHSERRELVVPIAHRLLSDDPLQRFVFVALVVGFYLRMQKHSHRANKIMLPIMPDDDCNSLYFLLMTSYELRMMFKRRNIFPSTEFGCINQQSDLPVLTDKGIDLRRNLAEVVGFQFLRRHDLQYIGGNNFCLDHGETSLSLKERRI